MPSHDQDQSAFLGADHGLRHPSTAGTQDPFDDSIIDANLQRLDAEGSVVLRGVLSPGRAASIRDELAPQLVHQGRNRVEGLRTQRLYSLITRSRACDEVLEHPWVLALTDRLLSPDYLLSQAQICRILPGEQAQPLHHDDSPYPVPRPRPPLSVSVMVALDPFTEDNGGTVVVPGSHRWGGRVPTDEDPRHSIVIEPGDALFFLGTLWHGGGANQTDQPRTGLIVQYCEPWLRTQENYALSVPRDRVRDSSPHIQRLLGYSVHRPFLGAVDGMHPRRLLDRSHGVAPPGARGALVSTRRS